MQKNFKNTFKKPLTFTLLNGIMYIEGKGETKKEFKNTFKKTLDFLKHKCYNVYRNLLIKQN